MADSRAAVDFTGRCLRGNNEKLSKWLAKGLFIDSDSVGLYWLVYVLLELTFEYAFPWKNRETLCYCQDTQLVYPVEDDYTRQERMLFAILTQEPPKTITLGAKRQLRADELKNR
nr:hypothetical protein L203_00396 [Cryptococcus depauperatus CBS 7841]